MANKNQVLSGLKTFIDTYMIPQAEGNYKIILRTAKAALNLNPDKIWNALQSNEMIKMLGVMTDEALDIGTLQTILSEGIGENEFELKFKLFGPDYKIYISSDDIRKLKTCIEGA